MKRGAFLRLFAGCFFLVALLFINSAKVEENSYPPCPGKATAGNFQQLTDNIKKSLDLIISQGIDIPRRIGLLVLTVARAPLLIVPGQEACRLGPPEPAAIVEIMKLLAVRILRNNDSQLKNERLRIEKERELQPLCDNFVDIDSMGVSSLGHRYKEVKGDLDKRKRYLRAFGIYFKNGVFRLAMEKFSSQEIKIIGQEITRDSARVNVVGLGAEYSGYVRETTPIVLYFKLQGNRWKIVDFQVAGLHYTSHNRTTFGEYYDRGFDRLIAFLEGQPADEKTGARRSGSENSPIFSSSPS